MKTRMFLLGLLLAWAGYLAPWVAHPAASLNIIGLDLGEYAKFVPEVRSGQISLWREGFYLPLAVISLGFSSIAAQRQQTWQRVILALIAVIAALQALPPAWSPTLLLTSEYRQQVMGMLLALVLATAALFRLPPPSRILAVAFDLLGLSALAILLIQFRSLLPAMNFIYGKPVTIGWGPYALALGLLLAMAGSLWERIGTQGNSSSS